MKLTLLQQRLMFGLYQGLILYGLFHARETQSWPATQHLIFAPLMIIGVVVPFLIYFGLGCVRGLYLFGWAALSSLLLGLVAYHDQARMSDMFGELVFISPSIGGGIPSFPLWFFATTGIFIGQSLLMAGSQEKHWRASYPTYFDVAWRLYVQCKLALLFVILFWLVLFSGAGLFELIKIDFFLRLFRHDWFCIPVTSLAAAYAVHVTDTRANLVRSFRMLLLNIMSWLLPVMAFFVAAFMLTLPFKGLSILWATHHTSQIMLGAAAWLIVLINAVYQDGLPEHRSGKLLRWSSHLACVLLVPITAIGIYALKVRVGEFGWTVNLVIVAACLVIAACYAIGYFRAALEHSHWLKPLEETNLATSYVILVVLFALMTPIADPARIAVGDQMRRLRDGVIARDKFDYLYLRHHGQVYGENALKQLQAEAANAKSPADIAIKDKIDQALSETPPYFNNPAPVAMQASDIKTNVKVYPAGMHLPEAFLKQDWRQPADKNYLLPGCLTMHNTSCDAVLVKSPSSPDNPDHILFLMGNDQFTNGMMFTRKGEDWRMDGRLSSQLNCKGVRDALLAGHYDFKTPQEQELAVGDKIIHVTHDDDVCHEK